MCCVISVNTRITLVKGYHGKMHIQKYINILNFHLTSTGKYTVIMHNPIIKTPLLEIIHYV